ncbi:hypothetical protein [Novosphingobium sp.]
MIERMKAFQVKQKSREGMPLACPDPVASATGFDEPHPAVVERQVL